MTTAKEFVQSGIKGSTFEAIKKAFGKSFNDLAETDKIETNFALAFAWFVEQGEPATTAHAHAMSLTVTAVADLFEDADDPAVSSAVDFD